MADGSERSKKSLLVSILRTPLLPELNRQKASLPDENRLEKFARESPYAVAACHAHVFHSISPASINGTHASAPTTMAASNSYADSRNLSDQRRTLGVRIWLAQ
jgi:hypothetical protein